MLAIGDTAPDLGAQVTEGPIRFREWSGDSWAVLFSHPMELPPVRTDRAWLPGQDQVGVRPPGGKDHRVYATVAEPIDAGVIFRRNGRMP